MTNNKMLIDASHPEETRVVVTRGNRIEEFDFESDHKKQLKGNIYLARVTRVEPSLQAAFVEYGGNRHGFLAFSEIHPDYYQIPQADRQALLEAEELAAKQEQDAEEASKSANRKKNNRKAQSAAADSDSISEDNEELNSPIDTEGEDDLDLTSDDTDSDEDSVESVGAEDALEELPTLQKSYKRDYKIQEVIKRRQIILVQVVKEERGNKGAALTTYLSLAGRYSVLMPNTARGGGISRKITNLNDRKRLKDIVKELDVPKGMGIILRTAGANRTKVEVKRDYEYLMRLWENVRTLTLTSVAPALVYEEGSLIKRSIRDLYNKDIEEIAVAGERGYREAKDFMRMLMPSHAKVVQPYRELTPIFARNGIETQLDRMLQPEVTLKSGGYLVINQTEALVAIDVNSGRSTKEHSVEETAVQTNLEAAEEIARQLRLRDLAGLVVIDFIDMEDKRNIRSVEKRLKDCLKDDRARIQVGRISHFGLMEMSRQRIRASVLESTMQVCPHCAGTGYVRSQSSVALHVMRSIEEYLLRNGQNNIIVRTPVSTALYVLNHKRKLLSDLELRFGLTISVEADETVGAQHLAIDKGTPAEGTPAVIIPITPIIEEEEIYEDIPEIEDEEEVVTVNEPQNDNKRRKNKKKRGNNDRRQEANGDSVTSDLSEEERNRRRRRRGRRGGRRNRDHYDNDRKRLPFAEPVGPFAQAALAEIRQSRRNRFLPAAEPVGFFPKAVTGNSAVNATQNGVQKIAITTPQTTSQAKGNGEQKSNSRGRGRGRQSGRNNNQPVVATTDNLALASSKNAAQNAIIPHAEPVGPFTKVEAAAPVAVEKPVTKAKRKAPAKQKAATPRRGRAATKTDNVVEATVNETAATNVVVVPDTKDSEVKAVTAKPRTRRKRKADDVSSDNAELVENTQTVAAKETEITVSSSQDGDKPKRGGWWQKKGFF
ncbi:Rne/Rng family ribonuclease [Bartonella sp. HY329]|uniref:Rne/Rng family ribonuclease n=1 Tax=unclassified Bartonella TaxID=2645622 RepID=UPI0021C9942E|nr:MULTISPECIES: ribonuclease E/G [unclassified Bartonella]UXM94195.1 Rne/Rng family ribonuclease [Bartonella sp. HY329]UXN08517.1 Rne/Rng family ribonuclease [Bartonella sp. HY328]